MTFVDPSSAIELIGSRLPCSRPLIVAIDGRSGVGKTTIARRLARCLPAVVIEGDDFFAGGIELRRDTARERAAVCIDWRSQRKVLAALRRGEDAASHRFDWQAFDGSRESEATIYRPAPVVLFEGVYSGRPELADLVDIALLLCVPREQRIAQLLVREGLISAWEQQWHEAEEVYFGEVVLPERFDLVMQPTLGSPG